MVIDDGKDDNNAIAHCLDVRDVLIVNESRMCLFRVVLGVSKVRERSQNLCFRETQIV